jgi:hypothetical protein
MTAACTATLLLVGGTAASARVLPPDPPGAPAATTGGNLAPATPGTSGTSVWEIALPVAGVVVAIALTILLIRVVNAHRSAGRRAATT